MELEPSGWIIVALCAMMVGLSKTGIPGVAILVVPLMAIAIPARQSVGVLLGILILADIFAVVYHRHNAKWGHVLRPSSSYFNRQTVIVLLPQMYWWIAILQRSSPRAKKSLP